MAEAYNSYDYTDRAADTPDDAEHSMGKYDLGCPAEEVYALFEGDRTSVLERARELAEMTIPSVYPPAGYKAGDKLPGNNQGIGAHCVNNLASRLMFMGFPPNQPMANIQAIETKLQPEIDQNPQLYAKVSLGLGRLEIVHRERMQATPLRTSYVGANQALLIGGNVLWKHIKLNAPTYHKMDTYVVLRDKVGHPLLTIHKEHVSVVTLSKHDQDLVYAREPDLLKVAEWMRKCWIYSICKLHDGDVGSDPDYGDKSWCYWQEYDGILLDGTEVETDYEDCPMWPEWLIPAYGSNWGTSYCDQYAGDLFTVEANASGLNDGAAIAAWMLTFVKPGGTTNINQVKKAPNLSTLQGKADDVTVLTSQKTADMNFLAGNLASAARRLAEAFLLQSSIRRDGERVTAEEITRMAAELDQAMGGLYTQLAQSFQRRVVMRFIRLHEESDDDVPPLPKGVVRVSVVTGIDALGRSADDQALTSLAATLKQLFPTSAEQRTNFSEFATRLASAKGVKPDGLFVDDQAAAQQKQQAQNDAMKAEMVSKATGPVAGTLADRLGQQTLQANQSAGVTAQPLQPPAQ